MKLLKT